MDREKIMQDRRSDNAETIERLRLVISATNNPKVRAQAEKELKQFEKLGKKLAPKEGVMDAAHEELLAAMEISRVVPNSTEQQHRLDELLAQGMCYCEARQSASQVQTDSVYRLSPVGKAYLEQRRGGKAQGE